jgi:hypothetical protein
MDDPFRELLETLAPKALDDLRRVLIRDKVGPGRSGRGKRIARMIEGANDEHQLGR